MTDDLGLVAVLMTYLEVQKRCILCYILPYMRCHISVEPTLCGVIDY